MLRLLRLLALLAAFHIVGGHWAVFQTAAWISMTVDYAKTESLETAVVKAIEGQQPCKMCVAIKKGRTDEEKQTGLKQLLKAEAVLEPNVIVLEPSAARFSFGDRNFDFLTRTEYPPTPPPLA